MVSPSSLLGSRASPRSVNLTTPPGVSSRFAGLDSVIDRLADRQRPALLHQVSQVLSGNVLQHQEGLRARSQHIIRADEVGVIQASHNLDLAPEPRQRVVDVQTLGVDGFQGGIAIRHQRVPRLVNHAIGAAADPIDNNILADIERCRPGPELAKLERGQQPRLGQVISQPGVIISSDSANRGQLPLCEQTAGSEAFCQRTLGGLDTFGHDEAPNSGDRDGSSVFARWPK
jgi:hypothetical protein